MSPSSARRRWGILLAAVVIVVLLVGGRWLALETAERAWADSVAGGSVYLAARDLARLFRGVVLLLSVAWGTGNLYFVYRAIGSVQMPRRLGNLEIVEAVPQRVLLAGVLVSGLLFGFILAWGTGDWWLDAALASAPPQFGAADPVLHRDLGYYVAELPWAATRQGYVLLATTTAAVLVALLYLGLGSLRFTGFRPVASPHARVHLGILLACVALALVWGAVLDPAEVVAGLHGLQAQAVLDVRLRGAAFVAALGFATAVASLVWAGWGRPLLLLGTWAALLVSMLAVYAVLPGTARSARRGEGNASREPAVSLERRMLERLALGTEWLEQRAPPGFPTPEAAAAVLPLWDPERVGAVARRAQGLGARATVAGAALWPSPAPLLPPASPAAGRPTWLLAAAPDDGALARAQPRPGWTEIHRGSWTRTGPPVAAVETDSGLSLVGVPGIDSVAWFGPGFAQFGVVAPDSWPATRASGIPLAGWWRRTALAWTLQSPELARAETDGLLLLWRRDVAERLDRLVPFADFEPPTPLVADAPAGAPAALWWIAYGYVESATFPLVRPVTRDGADHPLRYVRPGFIGAVNAASGETRVFLAPGYDSLAAAWARLFAPLIAPPDSLATGLRARLPYPRRAFLLAAAELVRSRVDSAPPPSPPWTPRSRDPFEVAAPPPAPSSEGAGGDLRLWRAQGFETGTPPRLFAGLLAGTMSWGGPRLFLWRPSEQLRLPSALLGSPQTGPGVMRLWLAGGVLVSLQGLFAQPPGAGESGAGAGSTAPRLLQAYVTWAERAGAGPTAALAVRDLLASGLQLGGGGPGAGAGADTSLAARWKAARRLAARADSALAAGDLELFGRLYADLKRLLGVGRAPLAPAPRPD